MIRRSLVCWALTLLWVETAIAAEPGKIPLDFPAVATTAASGQWVLCPPREFIDNAWAEGVLKTTFVYYAATMKEPGEWESTVTTLTKKDSVIPNSLIVPIAKGQTAKPGDIVLTWWHSGSGMQRAIVVEGGTETEPMVMYLDIAYDNPSGWGQKTDRCRPDSFVKLEKPLQIGTAVAVKDPRMPNSFNRFQLVAAADDKLLLVGYAGRMSVASKADCVPLPIVPEGIKEGDKVFAPVSFSKLDPFTVVKVDAKIGRVFVKAISFGKEKEVGVAFGDVIAALP